MADDAPAPRDIHLLTIDALLADLIGGRAVALGGGDELAISSDDARAVLDWYRQNRSRWQANCRPEIPKRFRFDRHAAADC